MKRHFFAYITISSLIPLCFLSQSSKINKKFETLTFEEVTEANIKSEMSYFTIVGSKKIDTTEKKKNPLREILPWQCNDSLIIYDKGNFFGPMLYIQIRISNFDSTGHTLKYNKDQLKFIDNQTFWGTSGELPKRRIRLCEFTSHIHKPNAIPYVAYNDLFEPELCTHTNSKKMKFLTKCRVFQSADNKRVYIYMLNGEGTSEYEVTFIIENTQYLMRVIDKTK